METLFGVFKQSALQFGDKVCISTYRPGHDDNARQALTFRQFYAALRHRALQLTQEYGLRKGDTVALLADNSLAYVILAFGAPLAGIRVLLISTKVLPVHLRRFLRSTDCRLIFASSAYENLARGIGYTVVSLDAYADLSSVPPVDDAAVALDADDCALIMHTSGTTSVPRLIYLSHRNILSNQQAVQDSVATHWTAADSSLLFLPLFHGYTLLSQLLRNINIGASTHLLQQGGSLAAESLVQALERTGVSFFCCVPWMLGLLHDCVLNEQKTGSSHALGVLRNLNFIITGGAPLEQNIGDFFTVNGVRLVTFFGLTEAAGFVMHSSFEKGQWQFLHPVNDSGIGFEALVAGSSEHELVLTASPMIADTSDAGGKPVPQRSHRTSDIFRRTPAGWAYLGRNDQMYNGPHGEKINPLLFEIEMAKLPEVYKVYVNGEDLPFNYALVELKPEFAGSSEVRNAILSATQSRINPALELPARVYPNDVIVLGVGEHLPLTSKGTVDRKAAKPILAARISAGMEPGSEHASIDIGALVIYQIRSYLQLPPYSSLKGSHGLLELGFDSLMTLSLRNTLQRDLGLEIPLDLMLSFPTVDTLIRTLEALQRTMSAPGGKQLRPVADAGSAGTQWTRIPLEQAIFHTAHYTFPFPTYNVSMSLLAPRALSLAEVEAGMRYLELRHEVLRSVYTPEGLFTIAPHSFVKEALLGTSVICGDHDISANAEAQAIIREYLNCAFALSKGPVYRYALIDVTDASGFTRTLVYVGLHHICGDFKGFNALVTELMEFLNNGSGPEAPESDGYAALVVAPDAGDLQEYVNGWRQLMTVMPTLREGLDFRAGHRQFFHFEDVNLERIAAILRKHNISLYNGVYAIYAVAVSRHLANQSLEDFHSATAVTSRITMETENLMGCFIHSPLLRFHLDRGQSMLQMMNAVQQTTREAFTWMITQPASYLREVVNDASNLVPFLTRNVFLYRSPEEIMVPLPGWSAYRNEFFFESCDVGMYLDFCANRRNQAMEGYVLINLHYCEPGVIQPILDDIRTLLRRVAASPQLDFSPLAAL